MLSAHPSVLSLVSPAAEGAGGCANPPGRLWSSHSRAVPCPSLGPGDTRGPGHVLPSVTLSQEQSRLEGGVLPGTLVTGTPGVVALREQSHWCPCSMLCPKEEKKKRVPDASCEGGH